MNFVTRAALLAFIAFACANIHQVVGGGAPITGLGNYDSVVDDFDRVSSINAQAEIINPTCGAGIGKLKNVVCPMTPIKGAGGMVRCESKDDCKQYNVQFGGTLPTTICVFQTYKEGCDKSNPTTGYCVGTDFKKCLAS